jgi:hypothetical protein
MHERKREPKRTILFKGQNVPVLYSSRRKDILGSEDWIARGTVQRIGATVFAAGFFCGSVALFVASFLMGVGAQTSEIIGGISGRFFGTMLAILAFLAACVGMFLTFRLVRGVVRSLRS